MSPTDYETVVNVEAYSLVKNTSDVTLTRELDGIFFVVFFVVQERYRQQNLDIFEMKGRILITIVLSCSKRSSPVDEDRDSHS